MLKLFVDDWRSAPQGWHLATTISEAIRVLATQEVSHVSLDHDIHYRVYDIVRQESFEVSSTEETFEPVCRFIKALNDITDERNRNPKSIEQEKHIKVYCHSMNPEARFKYKRILEDEVLPLTSAEI